MSRHLLLDRPDRQIVLGFDHMLRSFFGQVFRPDDPEREGIAVDGWPTKSGLGTRRPVTTAAEKAVDLDELTEWAKAQIPDEFESELMAAYHLGMLIGVLHREHAQDRDAPTIPLPACLKGVRA